MKRFKDATAAWTRTPDEYTARWLVNREHNAAVMRPREDERHAICIDHVEWKGHRICVLSGKDAAAVLADAIELLDPHTGRPTWDTET